MSKVILVITMSLPWLATNPKSVKNQLIVIWFLLMKKYVLKVEFTLIKNSLSSIIINIYSFLQLILWAWSLHKRKKWIIIWNGKILELTGVKCSLIYFIQSPNGTNKWCIPNLSDWDQSTMACLWHYLSCVCLVCFLCNLFILYEQYCYYWTYILLCHAVDTFRTFFPIESLCVNHHCKAVIIPIVWT